MGDGQWEFAFGGWGTSFGGENCGYDYALPKSERDFHEAHFGRWWRELWLVHGLMTGVTGMTDFGHGFL